MTERHYGEVLRTPELDEMPTYKNWIRGRGPLGPRISTSEAEPDGTIPPNTTLGKSRKKKKTLPKILKKPEMEMTICWIANSWIDNYSFPFLKKKVIQPEVFQESTLPPEEKPLSYRK